MDERIKVFAHNLIHKSIQVKSGDKVYIDYTGESTEGDLCRRRYAFPTLYKPESSSRNAAPLQ